MQENIIRKLDDNIVKLISAGEVIESPSSVIKELVENSIDSSANSIIVEIKNGGKDYIRVTDNGVGIDEKYVEIAFKKHTTSKITTYDDFINIRTNGFRGEALSSISAVAKVSMTTKTKSSNYGVNIVVENDKIIQRSKVGSKDGTTVIVEDLFGNIPARKKFLKTDRAESSKISDFLIRYCIANPQIKIKYINNSKQIFQTYGSGDIKNVVNIIFSQNYDNCIIDIDEKLNSYMSLKGIIGNNSAMFSSRKMQYIFINGRIIKDRLITSHIENAYKRFIPSGNFPMFFINLIINPNMVDVNIHPNKLEVKFSDEKLVYLLIENKISEILSSHTMIPQIKLSNEEDEKDKIIFSNIVSNYENLNKDKSDKEKKDFIQQSLIISKKYDASSKEDNFEYTASLPDIDKDKYEIEDKYILNTQALKKEDTVKINQYDKIKDCNNYEKSKNKNIDLENIKEYNKINNNLYEKDINIFKKESLINQNYKFEDNDEKNSIFEEKARYTIPKSLFKEDIQIKDSKIKIVDLTVLKYSGRVFDTYILLYDNEDMYMIDQHAAHERVLYERYMKDFYNGEITTQQLLLPQNIGIPVNLIDEVSNIINELNSFGFECDLFGDNIMLIRGIPSYFNQEGARKFLDTVFDIYLNENLSNDVIKDKIATKACKAAIKGNDNTVTEAEVEKLVYDLEKCENKYACPHGRPTITRISKYEIEKFFKRIL